MTVIVCKECKFYKAPDVLRKYLYPTRFDEQCTHPNCKDEIDGSPSPCITMRLVKCDRGRLFVPKSSEKDKAEVYLWP